MEEKKFDFEAFGRQAGEQLRSGKPLTRTDGVFTPLLKQIIEASLEGELDNHLQKTRKPGKNRRNGRASKNNQSSLGRHATVIPLSSLKLLVSPTGDQ